MDKKTSPIETHKKDDLILLREKLLEIIEGEKSKAKDIVDASKLLARMHKALSPEKITEKTPQENKKAVELSTSELADANELLNAN